MTHAETYARLQSTARLVDLNKWVYVDKRKPRKGQKVWICDADYWGWADYEFPAKWDGKEFIVDWVGGGSSAVHGVSYWQPRR